MNPKNMYKLVARAHNQPDTVLDINGLKIGGAHFLMMAGPCAVENYEQVDIIASHLSKKGVGVLRGGAFKPRTSPYSFQGLEEEGLQILGTIGRKYNLKIITEVMDASDISLVSENADILQIGARNMKNYSFLKALGKSNLPIMLKRGMDATIEEWLLSAEYIVLHGNPQVILCERGIRTFETATRNTLDLSAVALAKKLTHLPIVVDPSQGTGVKSIVEPLSKAALMVGADGLIVEVHHQPEKALSDGEQSLALDDFSGLWKEVQQVAQFAGKTLSLRTNKIEEPIFYE